MSRIKGGKLTVVYDTTKRQPLDSRMLVTKREDLINPVIWLTNGTTTDAMYNGMIVAVNNDGDYNGIYYLLNRLEVTEDNYTAYKTALANSENVDRYFSMWMKMAELSELSTLAERITELEETSSSEMNPEDYYTKTEVDEKIQEAIDNPSANTELEFHNRYEFPLLGQPNMLYIATDEDKIYY